jgi:SAM-dependent methyltransferase
VEGPAVLLGTHSKPGGRSFISTEFTRSPSMEFMQTWDASLYAGNGRFVAVLAASLVETLQPRAGERVLDLGCGDGFLTQRIGESGAEVVGVDSSPQMIAAAKERGVDARLINGEALPFHGEFDAVFSNAALHWMSDHDAVLAGVYQALKPGGRFVAECGGQGNIAAIRVALLAVLTARGIPRDELRTINFSTLQNIAQSSRGRASWWRKLPLFRVRLHWSQGWLPGLAPFAVVCSNCCLKRSGRVR